MHWKQPGFTYSAYEAFTKHCKRVQKFRETGNLKHLHRNGLDKLVLLKNGANPDSKDLPKRTVPDKILSDRAYEIPRSFKYERYQRLLASMVYTFYDRKTGSGISVNEQLAEELHKPVVIKNSKEGNSMWDLNTLFGQQI